MLDNLSTKQKKIIGTIGIIALVILSVFFYNRTSNQNTVDVEESILVANKLEEENTLKQDDEETIVVHITGAVKIPGVVRLKEGSRMEDAIQEARRINRRCRYFKC